MRLEPWYKGPKWKSHDRVFATIHHIDRTQEAVSKQHAFNFRLYAGFEALRAAGAGRFYQQIMPAPADRGRLSLNVVRACVDTIQAKSIQNKPKPTYLTMGGDASSQRKTKMTDKLANGMLYHTKVYDVCAEVLRDALAMGTGAIKISEDWDGKPRNERTFIEELKIDAGDGLHRNPKSMYQWKAVDRDVLLEDPDYKKFIPQIRNAGLPEEPSLLVHPNQVADQVAIAEAWHLPSTPYAKDGRHIICLDNVTLVDEPWDKPYHPFVFVRWNTRLLGFYGQAVGEQVSGIQYEINVLLRKVQEQMRLAGPKVFIERGANIVPSHLNNEIWGIIEYTGTEPKHVVFSAVEPELFAQIDRLYSRSFDEVGVSQMSAHSEKPAGLNSGKALMAYDDIGSARFIKFGQDYENLVLAVSDRNLDIARESHLKPGKNGKPRGFSIYAPTRTRGNRFLEKITWSDVDLARDEYEVQVFPTSLLPTTPIGKLQAVGDMMDRGMLKGDQAVSLLDFPDLEKVTSLITAALDDIDMMCEEMLDNGVALTPEPFSNMQLAIERMNSALLRAKLNGYDESRLELVRNYIAEADAKLNPPAPPPSTGPATASAGPAGGGGAPSMAAPALPNGMQAPPAAVAGAPGMAAA